MDSVLTNSQPLQLPLHGQTPETPIACSQCGETKTATEFIWKIRGARRSKRCGACRKANYKENPSRNRERSKAHYWANRDRINERGRASRRADPEHQLWMGARARARERGIAFDIEPWEVCIPWFCPVFGRPLVVGDGKAHAWSPTLDRIDSSKGYVHDNVIVVSQKANTMKSDSTPAEMRRLGKFYSELERDALTFADTVLRKESHVQQAVV